MMRLGKFHLIQHLAGGGMAELYLARQEAPHGFEKEVVLKRLLPSLAGRAEFVRQFINEARIASRLTHPNIARIYDLGISGQDYFMAMEYVHGHNLREIQDQSAQIQHPISLSLVTYIISQVCSGLHHAHTLADVEGQPLGLVHCDVSPQNILISFQGEVKLVDFGIAKAAALNMVEPENYLLQGKYAYMSPEQCRNEALDARSDIFTVGILLYELACQRRLFGRSSEAATIHAVLNAPIPSPSRFNAQIPEDLEQIIMKALARDLTQRYSDAQMMQHDLLDLMQKLEWPGTSVELSEYMHQLFRDAEPHDDPEIDRMLSGGSIELREVIPDLISELIPETSPEASLTAELSTPCMIDPPLSLATVEFSEEPTPVWELDFDEFAAEEEEEKQEEEDSDIAPSSQTVSSQSTEEENAQAPPRESPEQPLEKLTPMATRDPVLSIVVPPVEEYSPVLSWARSSFWTLVIVGVAFLVTASLVFYFKTRSRAQEPLTIQSDPPGAAIYINGQRQFGTTPRVLYGFTQNQSFTLMLLLEGYHPWEKTLVYDVALAQQNIKAQLVRKSPGGSFSTLIIHSQTSETEVYLNGMLQGKTPLVLNRVNSGKRHQLVLKKDGFENYSLEIEPLSPGEYRTIDVVLHAQRLPQNKKAERGSNDKKATSLETIQIKTPPKENSAIVIPRAKPNLPILKEKNVGERLPEIN